LTTHRGDRNLHATVPVPVRLLPVSPSAWSVTCQMLRPLNCTGPFSGVISGFVVR